MTPILPGANTNPAAPRTDGAAPPNRAEHPARPGGQSPSRIGDGNARDGLRGSQNAGPPPRQASPTGIARTAGAAELSAQWRAALAGARGATSIHDIGPSRKILVDRAADPVTRSIGHQLRALHVTLMGFDTTRQQFSEVAHEVDLKLQEQTEMPEQAVLIAYDDLKVQWQLADMRWPVAPQTPTSPEYAREA